MSELSITTTQNVNINFNAASVGERILAYFLDLIVKAAYGLTVYYIIFELFGLSSLLEGMDQWSSGSIIVFFALPVFFYTLVKYKSD